MVEEEVQVLRILRIQSIPLLFAEFLILFDEELHSRLMRQESQHLDLMKSLIKKNN